MQLKSSNKVIGNISLRNEDDVAKIGWISNKNYWNNGYMSETVYAVIQFAFQELRIKELFATCTERNIGSFKVMEKCGMKIVSTEQNLKAAKNGEEVTYNKLTYRI